MLSKATHPFGANSKERGTPYLFPYACVGCRSSFKRAGGPDAHVRPCVRCRAPSIRLSRRFKPPARSNIEQWRKVEALIRAGFHFESVPGHYPQRLSEVRAFVDEQQPYLATKRKLWPALMVATGAAMAGDV